MKSIKLGSNTTETRPSNSQVFNSSSVLNKSSINNNYLSQNIQQCENRQSQFLKIKNLQLKERIQKMADYILQLQQNKNQILGMNAKYVKIINQYYRDLQSKGSGVENVCSNSLGSINHPQKAILTQLQKQHRNLVKHCLVMEQQIINYTAEMERYNLLKQQLRSVNHTNVSQLIQQLTDLSSENKQLRKQNNRITYELQKSRLDNANLKKLKQKQHEQNSVNGSQIEKMLATVNTVKQESKDRADAYESKIYQLEVKVEKLESQLRKDQEYVWKNTQLRKTLQIQQVEHVHQRNKLKQDLSTILDPKRRPYSSSQKMSSGARAKHINARKSLLRRSDIFE